MPEGQWQRGATPRLRSGVAAGRRYPMSEVRGSGPECQAATAQEQLRGATPRPRSGAEARRTPCPRGGGQEELPHVQGQGRRPGDATASLRSGAAAERHYPVSKIRGGSQEELLPAQGQGRRPRRATPRPRSSGCMGT